MTIDLTRSAFALGYAEHGTIPIADRARASCSALEETAGTRSYPHLGRLIVEAGRAEGQRAKREQSHRRLYRWHADELAAALAVILARVDHDVLAAQIVEHAQQQAAADSTPVLRRRAMAGLALAAILAHVHAEDRSNLDTINAAGWAHATAYGTAEAQATPAKGGPPDAAKVAGLATAALALMPAGAPEAQAIASEWTGAELQSIAMGAALAAGDGAALGEATRAVKAALISTDRATVAYADGLHGAVNQAFIDHWQRAAPERLFNYTTDGNPCPTCIDAEIGSPYTAEELPGIPQHPNCRCSTELAPEWATVGA